MNLEVRSGLVRAKPGARPGVTLKLIKPGVVDDYGDVWAPDSLDEGLRQRLPTLCWSHDQGEPLGPAERWRSGADSTPEVDFAFSDFDAVPMARRAYAQVKDGTIRDCSIGFYDAQRRPPTKAELAKWPTARAVVVRACVQEVSLVIMGAIPGATVLATRTRSLVDQALDARVEAALDIALGIRRDWWR